LCFLHCLVFFFFLTNENFLFCCFYDVRKKKRVGTWHKTGSQKESSSLQCWTVALIFSAIINLQKEFQSVFFCAHLNLSKHLKMFRFSVASLHKCRRMFIHRFFFGSFRFKKQENLSRFIPTVFLVFFSKKNQKNVCTHVLWAWKNLIKLKIILFLFFFFEYRKQKRPVVRRKPVQGYVRSSYKEVGDYTHHTMFFKKISILLTSMLLYSFFSFSRGDCCYID
jgi:hypothetical protein